MPKESNVYRLGRIDLILLIIALATTVGLVWKMRNRSELARVPPSIRLEAIRAMEGTTPPVFELTALGGGTATIGGSREKPMLVYYYYHKCSSCILNQPIWRALTDSLGGTVDAIAISVESVEQARKFHSLDEVTPGFTISSLLRDSKRARIQREWRFEVLPTLFLLDTNGRVVLVHPGMLTDSVNALVRESIGGSYP